MSKLLGVLGSAALLAGCAQQASSVTAAYVSPFQFQNLTCPQIAEEAQRVSARAAQAAGTQDQRATQDAVAMGVALVVFWPAVFFVGGNNQNTQELARLRGEMDALEQASVRKNCGIRFERPKPPPPPEPARAEVDGG